jgi:hypothetical protein
MGALPTWVAVPFSSTHSPAAASSSNGISFPVLADRANAIRSPHDLQAVICPTPR